MKSNLKKPLIGLGALLAVASAGALYAQSHKPAGDGMMQGTPGSAMMQGGSGGMMGMMQMMSQMTQMMESCSTMMQNVPAHPPGKDRPPERKE
jgi:hypothetical protein